LVLGQDQGFPKDPTQVIEGLTETPNPSSEASDTPALTPTQEGKPRTYPTTLLHCNLCLFIYTYALSLGVVMKPMY
jgi:hypothetical protein